MLVLSRKRGERIIIGDNIEVTVIEVRGDRVKLGFVGPTDVPIHREEIFRRIEREAWHNESPRSQGRALVVAGHDR